MAFRLPPLNGLRTFEAAARLGSFKAAAEELFVTPAAVSFQIKALEQHLGVVLFRRMNRAVELTEAGQRCLPAVAEGFQCLSRGVNLARQSSDTESLVISAGPAFTTKWLAPRLHQFGQMYPHVNAGVSATLDLVDLERDGVDVAIRFGDAKDGRLYVQRIMEDQVVPLCSPRLLEDTPPLSSPMDLERYPLIHDESLVTVAPHSPNWSTWLAAAGVDTVDARRGMRFDHADHALQAAIDGAGVVLGRFVLATPDLRAERLRIPFGPALSTGLSYHLVCLKHAVDRPEIGLFRDWLVEMLQRECALDQFTDGMT